jgi:hypothetical protein
MGTYGLLILAFIGALWWFNHQRQQRLNADPGQHHLSSLLVAAALGRDGVTARDVADQLDRLAKGGAERRVRLTHAVLLVRHEAAPELYDKVLKLSRGL